MKRSEIVNLINNQIEGYMNPSSSRYTAEKILLKIEEVGMLPPHKEESTYGDCYRDHVNMCQWENE